VPPRRGCSEVEAVGEPEFFEELDFEQPATARLTMTSPTPNARRRMKSFSLDLADSHWSEHRTRTGRQSLNR